MQTPNLRPTGPATHATTQIASQRLAAGGGQLDGLRAAAGKDPKGAIKEVAKQFEALFMQELMKSMRATTMNAGMLDNNGSEMATGLLDQQYATQMTGRPGGLADAIARQLERQMGTGPVSADAALGGVGSTGTGLRFNDTAALRSQLASRYGQAAAPSAVAATRAGDATPAAGPATATPDAFLQRHGAAAEAVSAESGIPARFMLAQAAHETGWGRRTIRGADGSDSNNLFGIKAGPGWTGPTVTTTTTEVVDGQPQKVQARFRAYASAEDSFRDYARLIGNSPRYSGVMQAAQSGDGSGDATAFARGLQRAGYATDPQYATKLGRVIDTTERLQRRADAVAQAGGAAQTGVRT
jgi:flagellar protein FlgJ